MQLGGNTYPMRTSRITGESEMNLGGAWTKVGSAGPLTAESNSPNVFALTADDLTKLDGRAGLSSFSDGAIHYLLQCSIYNGTSYKLSDVTVRVKVEEGEVQTAMTRDFKLTVKNGVLAPSLANANFEAEVGIDLSKAKWGWSIVAATGHKYDY